MVDVRARKANAQGELQHATRVLVHKVERAAVKRFGKLVVKPRKLIVADQEVAPKPWPELDRAEKKVNAALAVVDGYAPYYARYQKAWKEWNLVYEDLIPIDAWDNFDPFALKLSKKFREGGAKHTLFVAAVQRERDELVKAFKAQRSKLLKRLRKARRYRKGVLVEPKIMVGAYRRKIRQHFGRIKRQKPGSVKKGNRPKWF